MKLKFYRKGVVSAIIFITIIITYRLCRLSVINTVGNENEVAATDMIIRLELFTSNIPQTVRFYQDVLGFKPLNSASPNYQPIQNGQVLLGIGLLESLGNSHYFNTYQNDTKFGYGVEIVFEVDDIQLIYNKVKRSNVEIESELKDRPWGLKDFRLIDPNGYYIRVTSKS
jgi:uncharacterized glyoxalase superfamily protein PhnB